MMKKYKKDSVVVEAVQFIMGSERPVTEFLGLNTKYSHPKKMLWENENAIFELFQPEVCSLKIKTLRGIKIAHHKDYIIKGEDGKFYPCSPDVFKDNYKEVSD